jgi:hypothetical protein
MGLSIKGRHANKITARAKATGKSESEVLGDLIDGADDGSASDDAPEPSAGPNAGPAHGPPDLRGPRPEMVARAIKMLATLVQNGGLPEDVLDELNEMHGRLWAAAQPAPSGAPKTDPTAAKRSAEDALDQIDEDDDGDPETKASEHQDSPEAKNGRPNPLRMWAKR